MPKTPSDNQFLIPDNCVQRRYGPSPATVRLANDFLLTHSLSEILPYRSFDPETQLFVNRSSLGFVIETLPLVGCDEKIPPQLTGLFQHTLPLGSNLQCLLIASSRVGSKLNFWEKARYHLPSEERSEILQHLAHERVSFMKHLAKGQGVRTFRLLVSYSEPLSGLSASRDPSGSEAFNRLMTLRKQIETTVQGFELPFFVWGADDLLKGLDEILNPSESLDGTPSSWNPYESLSNQLMRPETRFKVEPSHLLVGERDKLLRLYTTRLLPPAWHLGAMGNLIGDSFNEFLRLKGPFFLSYGIHICHESTLKTKMLAKCGNVERQAASPIAKYVPSLRKEAEEWQYVREKFEEGQRLVRTRFQVGLMSDPLQIQEEEQTLFNLYRSQRWDLALDKYIQLPSFLSCLPMTWGEGAQDDSKMFQKAKTTLSHEPVNLMPIQGEWQGTKSPGMLLVGRRGQLFNWSPFDNNEGNYNTCVVGRSGSGKSVFMQDLLTSMLGMGGRVFVLDVGRSFEKTVKLLKGTYVEFKSHTSERETRPLCINPFSSIPTNDPEAASDALSMLKPILSLMAAPKEGTNDLEDAYLEQAIQKAWKQKENLATIIDVEKALLSHPDPLAKSLGARLYPYTEEGGYRKFFNGPATINLSDQLVVIELEELKERKDLQSVIVQMVILQIANSVYGGNRKTPSCLILDEAWDMLRGKQSGIFIETAARRLRKYNGGLVVGTQSINDFYATPGAQAAFENADWLCLLSQKDESIELLKSSKRLSMDPAMERTLRSLRTEQGKYAEVMIKWSKGFAVGRLLLDPFSKVLYSTKADEFAAVQTLLDQGSSLVEAVREVSTW